VGTLCGPADVALLHAVLQTATTATSPTNAPVGRTLNE
jgi:hypothetical protein